MYRSVHAQYTETTPPLSRNSWLGRSFAWPAVSISLAFARSFEIKHLDREEIDYSLHGLTIDADKCPSKVLIARTLPDFVLP